MSQQSSTGHANRIALYNAKGGTGKTTVGINLAGALARADKDVLFVDLDPQGNATEGLGFADAYDDEPPNLLDALLEPGTTDVSELVRVGEEFDVLPSNVDLMQAERELTIGDYEGEMAVRYLNQTLDELEAESDTTWEYVIVDAPPFFGQLTDNALYATRNVIVPSLAESTSQRAVEILLDQIQRLERDEDIFIDEVAAVANRVESTNEAERMSEWLETVFEDIPVFSVRKRVALQRAYRNGVSIFEHSESSDMEVVFQELADAVIEHFDGGGEL